MAEPSADITYAGNPLDRASVRRDDKAWLDGQLTDPATRFLCIWRGQALMGSATPRDLLWLPRAAVADLLPRLPPPVFLGLDGNGAARFALDLSSEPAPDAEAELAGQPVVAGLGIAHELRGLAPVLSQGDASIIAQAKAITDWNARHGFCAQCGSPTTVIQGGWSRRCTNESCGASHFPRTDPAVIMLVARGGRCVLARNARYKLGFVSVLAGFVEPGETVEEAVRREVQEEVGLRVGAVRYYATQPWPFPSSLMIGCYAEALDETIALHDNEIEEASWVERDALARVLAGDPDGGFSVPPPLSIAHRLMTVWTAGYFD